VGERTRTYIPMNISVFRLSLIKDQVIPYAKSSLILTPLNVYELIKEYLQGTDREHFIALFLDSRSEVIGINTVSVGTLTESLVHAREVFKGAILANAAKLKDAGRLLGIPLEDHVIIGREGFTSFRENGLL
jgi:DNA repair protein RadC